MSVYDTMVAGLSSAGLVLLGFVATQGTSEYHLNAAQLQARLQHNAETALREGGFEWASVSMDGQSATLGGYPPSDSAAAAASLAVLTSSGKGGYLWGGVWQVTTDFDTTAPVTLAPVVEPAVDDGAEEPVMEDNETDTADAEQPETDLPVPEPEPAALDNPASGGQAD